MWSSYVRFFTKELLGEWTLILETEQLQCASGQIWIIQSRAIICQSFDCIGFLWNNIIIIKLLFVLFVYKILNNQAPKYIDTCLNSYTPTRSLRSSSDPLRLTYSVTRTLAGDRTFTVSASKYWNDLPLTVRQSSSVSAFKKALKTHLFSSL